MSASGDTSAKSRANNASADGGVERWWLRDQNCVKRASPPTRDVMLARLGDQFELASHLGEPLVPRARNHGAPALALDRTLCSAANARCSADLSFALRRS
jgi:hypothetical protein